MRHEKNLQRRAFMAGLGCVGATQTISPFAQTPLPYHKIIGQGAQTLVFLSGLGDDHTSFLGLAHHLAPSARCIVYDRAGYGKTPLDPTRPSHALHAAQDLERLMDGLKIDKAVLVGHSLGGVFAQVFTDHYTDRVSGLCLIESRPVGFDEACARELRSGCSFPSWMKAIFPKGGQAEVDALLQTQAQTKNLRPLSLPVSVLVRKDTLDKKGFDRLWIDETIGMTKRLYINGAVKFGPVREHYLHQKAKDFCARALFDLFKP